MFIPACYIIKIKMQYLLSCTYVLLYSCTWHWFPSQPQIMFCSIWYQVPGTGNGNDIITSTFFIYLVQIRSKKKPPWSIYSLFPPARSFFNLQERPLTIIFLPVVAISDVCTTTSFWLRACGITSSSAIFFFNILVH